ncbi:hypothetical protein AOLI_G00249740 [Acnodon oligacanthus]
MNTLYDNSEASCSRPVLASTHRSLYLCGVEASESSGQFDPLQTTLWDSEDISLGDVQFQQALPGNHIL